MAPIIGSDLRSCLSTSTGLFNERVPVDWGTQRARLRVDVAADLVLVATAVSVAAATLILAATTVA